MRKRAHRGWARHLRRRGLISQIVRRDGDCRCWVCGEPIDRSSEDPRAPDAISLDHQVPVSRGGVDALSNLKLAHVRCNRARGNLTPDEWAALQRQDSDE